MVENSKVNKRGSIKLRLIIIPLLVVLIVVAGIGVMSSYFIRTSLLNEMERNGYYTSERIISNLNDNSRSLETIDFLLEDKVRSVGKNILDNENNLDNNFMKRIARDFNVDQVSWYNANGVIVYSNVNAYIGWATEKGHPIYDFMTGKDNELMEEIRQDTESMDYLKYGYLKGPFGTFVQVGINANRVQELTDSFGYQSLLEDLSQDKEIVYAIFIDKNLEAIAHSNKDEIGIKFDDAGTKSAAIDGIPFSQQRSYGEDKIKVLDVLYPAIVNGEHIGAVSIGYSMEGINSGIIRNIGLIGIAILISLILLAFILYTSSNYAVKIINRLKEQMGYMAEGDFSKELPVELLEKNDEFGEISQAVNLMQDSIRGIIKNVIDTSNHLASSSEELTAISHQSAVAADEVARAIEQIAAGASDQAKDTEEGALSIVDLGEIVLENESYIGNLNRSAEKVNLLKDEGLELLKELVDKTDINKKSSEAVQRVILETNDSSVKIVKASEMIRNIAEQTNLLALNAAIEAARAGEAGRGFAVVAEEIRKLAEESNAFTEEIALVVNELSDKTSVAVRTMEELEEIITSQAESVNMTDERFVGISQSIEEMEGLINRVNDSSQKMIGKKEDIIQIMENLSAISQENAASTEEASASVEEQTAAMEEIASSSEILAKMAEELNKEIEKFKI